MNVFLSVDWQALESWLVAHFANDVTMFRELEGSLRGEPKPHALNAAMLYGCRPEDAKSTVIVLGGQPATAYDGGKRLAHMWNYGGGAGKMEEVFWIERAFAVECERRLSEKYRQVVQWRERIADEVFGAGVFVCGRCGHEERVGGLCPTCPKTFLSWRAWTVKPLRLYRTPFGRRRLYPGRRAQGANALASQLPQSSGASLWYRTLHRLHGFEVERRVRRAWPLPAAPFAVVTGTYDSYLVECHEQHASAVGTFLLWTMEQPWPQLGGLRFPAELSQGYNYGTRSFACFVCGASHCTCGSYEPANPDGLHDVDRGAAFTYAHEWREAS